jgi:hypothetical protein
MIPHREDSPSNWDPAEVGVHTSALVTQTVPPWVAALSGAICDLLCSFEAVRNCTERKRHPEAELTRSGGSRSVTGFSEVFSEIPREQFVEAVDRFAPRCATVRAASSSRTESVQFSCTAQA